MTHNTKAPWPALCRGDLIRITEKTQLGTRTWDAYVSWVDPLRTRTRSGNPVEHGTYFGYRPVDTSHGLFGNMWLSVRGPKLFGAQCVEVLKSASALASFEPAHAES